MSTQALNVLDPKDLERIRREREEAGMGFGEKVQKAAEEMAASVGARLTFSTDEAARLAGEAVAPVTEVLAIPVLRIFIMGYVVGMLTVLGVLLFAKVV